jgi:phage portal protein BeeE
VRSPQRSSTSAASTAKGVTKRVALQYPGKLNKEQAKIALETFKAAHTGSQNAHLPAILTDGATLGDFGMTLEDAQFIESERLNLVQAANIFRIPPKFVTGETI